MQVLPVGFYRREAKIVASALLGKILFSYTSEGIAAGRIVETEAYLSKNDPACHGSCGKTKRNEAMFGPPGRAYVYFIYGNHYCFNVVTGNEGQGEAVLIRALEPTAGFRIMQKRRGKEDNKELTNGPGKICQALKIDLSLNGISLQKPPLILTRGYLLPEEKIVSSPRIGISKGKNKLLRFYLQDNPFVSGKQELSLPL